MKNKKLLLFTLCLVFGTSQITQTISWSDIKSQASSSISQAMQSIHNVKKKMYNTTNNALLNDNIHCGIFAGLSSLILTGFAMHTLIIKHNNWIEIEDKTKYIATVMCLYGATAASITGIDYALQSKMQTIKNKILNNESLTEYEQSVFKQALISQMPPYSNQYWSNYSYHFERKTYEKIKSQINTPEQDSNIIPYSINELQKDEFLIKAIQYAQQQNNQEFIDIILNHIFYEKTTFSCDLYQEALPFVEKYGADYIKRNGINIDVNNPNPIIKAHCIFCDKALAQYIQKYGTAQENLHVLAALINNVSFRPHTLNALAKKLGDVNTLINDLKQKMLYLCTNSADILDYHELMTAFPDLKNAISEKLLDTTSPDCFVNPNKPLLIDARVQNTDLMRDIRSRISFIPTTTNVLIDTLITSDYRWSSTDIGTTIFERIKKEHPDLLQKKLMEHLKTSNIWHIAFLDFLLTEYPETTNELKILLEQKDSLDCLKIDSRYPIDKKEYPTALTFGRKIQLHAYKKGQSQTVVSCPFLLSEIQ